MKEDLAKNWGVRDAKVLHDRPPPMFAPTPLPAKHALIKRLQEESPDAFSSFGDTVRESKEDTLFTTADGAERADRLVPTQHTRSRRAREETDGVLRPPLWY